MAIGEFAIAADVDELRAQAAVSQPGIVLLDWALPGLLDGQGLAELRAAAPTAAIVVLSIQPEDRDPALKGGAVAFVYKAMSPDEVVRIIEQAIKGTKENDRGGI